MRLVQAMVGAPFFVGCFYSIDDSKVTAQAADAGTAVLDAGGDSTPAGKDAGAIEGPTDGLVGYWSFEEASGTAVLDRSGHGNDGLLQDAIARDEGAPGHGRGISTDANAALDLGRFRIPSLDRASFPRVGTLSLWLRARRAVPDDTPAGTANAFFGLLVNFQQTYFGPFMNLIYEAQGSGPDVIAYAVSGPAQPTTEISALATRGRWTHVVAVWTGSEIRLFTGESTLAAVTPKTYLTSFAPTEQECVFLRRMVGDLDEVRLYNRPLPDDEVRAIP